MFERFTERARKVARHALERSTGRARRLTGRARKIMKHALAASSFVVIVEITVRLQDTPAPKDLRYRPVHHRHKRPRHRRVRRFARGYKRFIRRRGPGIARFIRRWGSVIATSVLPIMVAALQIVTETLKLLGEFI